MDGSVAFDRAAEYYDRTRGSSPEGLRKTIDLLTGELRDRGTVLEVGVGTGQLGLPCTMPASRWWASTSPGR